MTFYIWEEFDPKGLAFLGLFLFIQEVFIHIRWRVTVVCKQCGFDPVLYRKKPELAASHVKDFLERRKTDPRYVLARPLDLPKISAEKLQSRQKAQEREQRTKSTGRILSQRI